MDDKFKTFKMLFRRETLEQGAHDVRVTSAYISFNRSAMKQLQVTLGDRVAVAGVEEDDGTGKILIAPSLEDTAYKVLINPKVKRTTPLIFVSIGKKYPELKGNYFLHRYGSHQSHEWWELVKEKPRKIRFFNKGD